MLIIDSSSGYSFVDDVFSPEKEDLSTYYTKWGRVLVILDEVVAKLYGDRIKKCKHPLPSLSCILGS